MLRLKSLLTTLKVPQARLASACGISAATLSQIVNHQRWPKTPDAAALRERITAFLTEHGADQIAISRAFELVHR